MISRNVGALLHIILVLLFVGANANCINKSESQVADLSKASVGRTLPNIPYEKFGDKYYYFGAIFEGNYFQATQFCNYNGMSLLSIETKEENDFLWDKLRPFLGWGEYHFWTSGTTLPDDHWVWLDTGKPVIFANWLQNQPDNAGNNEKCLEVRYSHTYKSIMWNDHVCTVPKHVICETKDVKCITNLTAGSVSAV